MNNIDVNKLLNKFEPIEKEDFTEAMDISLVENYIDLAGKISRMHQKSNQTISYSLEQIIQSLKKNDTLIENLKEQKTELTRENEVLVRLFIDMADIIYNYCVAAQKAEDINLINSSLTLIKAFELNLEKIGLKKITGIGENPDSLYHYVIEEKLTEDKRQVGKILEIYNQGYTYNGKILKKAEVVIGK